MREIRPSGLEGGVALTRRPYPYPEITHFQSHPNKVVEECCRLQVG